MSTTPIDETPAQRRLRLRVEQSQHNEEQVRLQRERRSAGCKSWADRHPGRHSLPIDRQAPARSSTNSAYDVFADK